MIGNNIRRAKAAPQGFTLVEMLVAIALFVGVMTIATQIFLKTADSQETSVASKNIQESVNFAMSKMVAEMKTAQADMRTCDDICDAPGQYYCMVGSDLVFRNAHGACVRYALDPTTEVGSSHFRPASVKATNHGSDHFLTPETIRVSALKFSVSNAQKPQATVYLKAQSLESDPVQKSTDAQMTVSPSSESFVPAP